MIELHSAPPVEEAGRHLTDQPGEEASSAPPSPLIGFRNICFDYAGKRVLENINLEIGRQEIVCVVGPSGCGKTTTLRLIAGLLRPTAGEIIYDGRPLKEPARDIAVVFQDYTNALLPWRNAAGNVALALEAAGVPKAERKARISALLEKVGLAHREEAFPSELSGGQQQRLQIARCLAQEPSVLLMDEPFGALDAMTRQHLQDQILQIMGSSGTTVFFVTHDLEEAIYLADRVIALAPNPGRVAQIFDIDLPRPRNQLTTREDPRFLKLRRQIFDFVQDAET